MKPKTFRQCFELETECKSAKTALKRFAKKYPAAWEVWGEMLEYMLTNGIEHEEEKACGWSLWLYVDEQIGTHYLAIVLTDEAQRI